MGKHQEAFYELLAARSNPVRQYVGTLYGPDSEQVTMVKARSPKAAKRAMGRMGSKVLDDFRKLPRGSREVGMDVSEGVYGFQAKHTRPAQSLKAAKAAAEHQGWNVDSSHYLRPGVYDLGEFASEPHSNPGQDRLTPQEMAQYKAQISRMLESGISHADVRKQLGNMSFPLYQAIRRSGGTKGARPVHRGSAHLLRNPAGMRVPGPGRRFTALSTYYDIAGMGQYDSQMNMRFEVNADGSATHIRGGGDSHGNTLPAAAVRRLFEDGHCGGLGNSTSLSKPEIE